MAEWIWENLCQWDGIVKLLFFFIKTIQSFFGSLWASETENRVRNLIVVSTTINAYLARILLHVFCVHFTPHKDISRNINVIYTEPRYKSKDPQETRLPNLSFFVLSTNSNCATFYSPYNINTWWLPTSANFGDLKDKINLINRIISQKNSTSMGIEPASYPQYGNMIVVSYDTRGKSWGGTNA